MIPDVGILQMIWPTNDVKPSVYVPTSRSEFGQIDNQQVQPASLDVRLARDLIRHPSGEYVTMGDGGYSMAPGECLLATCVETFEMRADNVVARIEGKSSWARRFLTIHAAGFIDPGFCGDITLELKNDGHARIHLNPGIAIAQVAFSFLAGPTQRVYGDRTLGSHYQYQSGPTPSWIKY